MVCNHGFFASALNLGTAMTHEDEANKENKRENKKGLPNTGEVDRLPFLSFDFLLIQI